MCFLQDLFKHGKHNRRYWSFLLSFSNTKREMIWSKFAGIVFRLYWILFFLNNCCTCKELTLSKLTWNRYTTIQTKINYIFKSNITCKYSFCWNKYSNIQCCWPVTACVLAELTCLLLFQCMPVCLPLPTAICGMTWWKCNWLKMDVMLECLLSVPGCHATSFRTDPTGLLY